MGQDIGRALRAADFAAGEVERFRRQLGEQRAEYHRLAAVLEADAAARREEAADQRRILEGMAAGFAASVARTESTVERVVELAQAAHQRADDAHVRLDAHAKRLDGHDERFDRLEARRWALWLFIAAVLFGGGVAVGSLHSGRAPVEVTRP